LPAKQSNLQLAVLHPILTLRDSQQRAVAPLSLVRGSSSPVNPLKKEGEVSKSESRKATKSISFRLTPDELIQVQALAAASKVGVSTFARRATFSASALPVPSYEQKTPDNLSANLHRVLGEIGRIGNNLNQVAKIANSTKTSPVSNDLRLLFAELRALRQDILRGVK